MSHQRNRYEEYIESCEKSKQRIDQLLSEDTEQAVCTAAQYAVNYLIIKNGKLFVELSNHENTDTVREVINDQIELFEDFQFREGVEELESLVEGDTSTLRVVKGLYSTLWKFYEYSRDGCEGPLEFTNVKSNNRDLLKGSLREKRDVAIRNIEQRRKVIADGSGRRNNVHDSEEGSISKIMDRIF